MKRSRQKQWQAVMERDASSDDSFVYAVKTTMIYCKPSCPSRRPKPENVEFFTEPKFARAAGYRPCSRCKPDIGTEMFSANVRASLTYIHSHAHESIKLADIACAAGLTPSHFHRQFKKELGLTPNEYVKQFRLARLKQSVREGKTVTESIYDAGYSSSSRLYEQSTRRLGMTPREYSRKGKNQKIAYAFTDTPLGLALLGATQKGLCFLQFGDNERELLSLLRDEFEHAEIAADEEQLTAQVTQLNAFLQGREASVKLPTDLRGTPFQIIVWQHLMTIPSGEIKTYSQIAHELGRLKATRAVASACAANKIAIAVPCHRVVRSDGGMAGYRWGVTRKRHLLNLETPHPDSKE